MLWSHSESELNARFSFLCCAVGRTRRCCCSTTSCWTATGSAAPPRSAGSSESSWKACGRSQNSRQVGLHLPDFPAKPSVTRRVILVCVWCSGWRGRLGPDPAVCQQLPAQQAGRPLPGAVGPGAPGLRPPLSARLRAAFLQDPVKGRAQGIHVFTARHAAAAALGADGLPVPRCSPEPCWAAWRSFRRPWVSLLTSLLPGLQLPLNALCPGWTICATCFCCSLSSPRGSFSGGPGGRTRSW